MIITGQEKHEGYTLEVKSESVLGRTRPTYYFFCLDDDGNEVLSKDVGQQRDVDLEKRFQEFKEEVSAYSARNKTETNESETEEEEVPESAEPESDVESEEVADYGELG
tara:strand:- start:1 stop:327 length:327 start_codon:yes stop_codon:yes gene_type:complete